MKSVPGKRRPEEPKITCPVCGDAEKVSSYSADNKMCSRCWDYLDPEKGGKDYGLFMVRILTDADRDGRRRAEIRPRGFWSGTIEIAEGIDYSYDPETKAPVKTWAVRVSWGCGGTDGTVDETRAAENFTRGIEHGVMLAKTWKMERQENKEA